MPEASMNPEEQSGILALRWPADGLEYVPNCPVCHSAKRQELHLGLRDQVFGIAPGEWDLYRCSECANAWLDPRPTVDTLPLAYARYYTHSGEDHPIVRRIGPLRSFLHDAMQDYRNRVYGLSRQPSLPLGRWLLPLLPPLRAAVDAQCRHLPAPPEGGGHLLDIGFGSGGFLEMARESGWHVEGIEFDARAVAAAAERGLLVRQATTATLLAEERRYDIITISHVIEHVPDPVQLLEDIYSLLTPGGRLWCETPNLRSRGHARFGRNWRDLDPPRHLVLFSLDGLKALLARSGLTDIRQHWRGMSVFDTYPVSAAIQQNTSDQSPSRQGKPLAHEIIAELLQMIVPSTREFTTLTARKPDA